MLKSMPNLEFLRAISNDSNINMPGFNDNK